MNKNYIPMPINTNDVKLDSSLLELTELIAKNTHEVWAEGRMKEGWTYGPKKDGDRKETPCMIPYEELSDSEKEYDRQTAMEAIKLIVKLGYKIIK